MMILKDKIQSAPVLVFPDFDKPFLLDTDVSKEGLGYFWQPLPYTSRENYHSSKLEFLALKWSITEHFKEYLAYTPFVVRTDKNPLTYVLTTPNLDTTGHRWIGMLASFEFDLEYQKEVDNWVADVFSRVPICHNHQTVRTLMEVTIVRAED